MNMDNVLTDYILRMCRISRDFVSSHELFARLSDSKYYLMFTDYYVFIAYAMNRYAHNYQMALMFLIRLLYIDNLAVSSISPPFNQLKLGRA